MATVNSSGFTVGLNFGSGSSISINGDSISEVLGTKQDKNSLVTDLFAVGSVVITTTANAPYTDGTWTQIHSVELSVGKTMYFWERTA